MTLSEYYEEYRKALACEFEGDFPRDIASCIAAAHYAGLSIEQLKKFMIRRSEISSVSVALENQNTSISDIEKIIASREEGKLTPSEILLHAFNPLDVKEKYRAEIFNGKNA
ncbi:hypothetical protein FT643_22170 [Ketobacter sp. MCCC 1A13808]|uniref:hypothetical protein n=1 Tax=Ketobacter sp. MCCC 1A13808 TaxID=2602738 RepID=UPI0012EC7494|nr:hypothetical protein [Ketobacter sp. MCCC 1A13808]MVF14846.1 hypothetical protein [Ketobacter sp. MCCC 1A13808]